MWETTIAEVGMGNVRAAVEAEKAISHFAPDVAILVGIAGGIKDVSIGDVVSATKVYGYEAGKSDPTGGFRPRPEAIPLSYRLEQISRMQAHESAWHSRLGRHCHTPPKVYLGPIAAGEKVLASSKSKIAEFIRTNYEDAMAVEMEGRGFIEATRTNDVQALIVRGISDLLEGKREAEMRGSKVNAAEHAAAFAFEVLSRHIPSRLTQILTKPPKVARRVRDLEQLRLLLADLPAPVLDQFFERAACDIFIHDIFWYWEGFAANVRAGDFHLFDRHLEKRVRDLHVYLGRTLGFHEHSVWMNSGEGYSIHAPTDPRQFIAFRQWYGRFGLSLRSAEKAYHAFLECVKTRYPEIDLRQTSREAILRCTKWHENTEKNYTLSKTKSLQAIGILHRRRTHPAPGPASGRRR